MCMLMITRGGVHAILYTLKHAVNEDAIYVRPVFGSKLLQHHATNTLNSYGEDLVHPNECIHDSCEHQKSGFVLMHLFFDCASSSWQHLCMQGH